MLEVNYKDYVNVILKNIAKGAFLTVLNGNKLNTMTIGWGSFGIIWGKPTLILMVRKSRYTYQLIENSGQFTVSFPGENELKKELVFCGTNSGRKFDKFKECQLTPVKGSKIETPIVGEGKLHFECKTIYKQEMQENNLDKNLNNRWYPDKDYHTFYYAEILGTYINDSNTKFETF